jgi:hypothetical protein
MVGSMVKGIYGNLAGILDGSWIVGTKGGMTMMIAVAAAVRCMVNFLSLRRVRWLDYLLGHFFLRLQEDWTIPCPMICVSIVIHVVQRSVLFLAPTSPPARVATSGWW